MIDVTESTKSKGTNPIREPHHMTLNFAMKGSNVDDPAETALPARLDVDCAQVYQRSHFDCLTP